MKYNKFFLAAAMSLALVSCSDEWDNHYQVAANGETAGSLWQQLANKPELSNFKTLLEATGYDRTLSGSQIFTVFAPTNDNLTADEVSAMIASYKEQKSKGVKDIDNTVIKEFVQNHIALYNYSVSTHTRDSIVMMNRKYLLLDGQSLAGVPFEMVNAQASNGVLFTLRNVAEFSPNVYEYISKDADLDSLYKFVYKYSIDEFQPDLSVPGEYVDGKTTYLDSVTMLQNTLFSFLGKFNNEDSTYWMLAPTNEVWRDQLLRNEEMFQYDKKVIIRDSMMYFMPRLNILRGTLFSSSFNKETAINDSAVSTNAVPFSMRESYYGSYDKKYYQYDRPFDEGGIFYGTETKECSNGRILKASQWNINRAQTFLRDITMEGENDFTLDSVDSQSTREPEYASVPIANTEYYDKVSRHNFMVMSARSNSDAWGLFKIWDVLSNVDYDVYVVNVPNTASDTLAVNKGVKYRCAFYCNNEDGEQKLIVPDGTLTDIPKPNEKTGKVTIPSKCYTKVFDYKGEQVDSILIGTYRFPTCSYGLEKAQVEMRIECRVSSSDVNKGYERSINLDCIVFKPHEEK